jgi:EthD domain
VSKLFVFVRRATGVAPGRLWDAWGAVIRDLLAQGPGRRVRRAVENRAIADANIPELKLSRYDGAYELWFDGMAELQGALGDHAWRRRLQSAAADLTAPASTLLLAAQEAVQFDRGAGAVKFMALSRRSARFGTREDWIRYWVEVHGPMAHGIPEFTRYYGRYVHNYVVPLEHASGGLEPQFDGIVEEWVASVESFARCLAEPKYLELVRPDELLFVDFAGSHVLLVEEHPISAR